MKVPRFQRALILGLDALPWSVVGPMIEAGSMPYLGRLAATGCSGNLRSTIPHQTPAAWTTFMTGVQPGTHGILNWERFDPTDQAEHLHNMEPFVGRTIYDFFSRCGKKVGVIMQPMLYPPFPVNGYMLSGFDSPGISAPFAYPREWESRILDLCPAHDRNINVDLDWKTDGHEESDLVFAHNIDLLIARTTRTARLALDLQREHPTDVWMIYFHDPDLLLHRAWKWAVPEGKAHNPVRHAKIVEYFRALDAACQECSEAMLDQDRLTLVLSDHGQRADRLRVRLNSILAETGLLVPSGGLGLVQDAVRRIKDSLSKKEKRTGIGISVDWSRTKAFLPFQACTGFVYINLVGRQPFGSVEPRDYERVRDEVVEELRAYKDPKTGERYFEEVGPTDGIFKRKAELNLPDIFVQPAPGVEFVRKAVMGERVFATKRLYAGLHDPNGLYILHGASVRAQGNIHAQIMDLAPTLLAALGLPVPSYMEGEVLNRCMEWPLEVIVQPSEWALKASGTEGYTPQQEAEIEARLSDLGYLD